MDRSPGGAAAKLFVERRRLRGKRVVGRHHADKQIVEEKFLAQTPRAEPQNK